MKSKKKSKAKIAIILISILTIGVGFIASITSNLEFIKTVTGSVPVVLNLEHTPDQEEDAEKIIGNIDPYGYGDQWYTKARMIYDTISQDSGLQMLLKFQLPAGTDAILPKNLSAKNILEWYIIFTEALNNETAKTKYNLDESNNLPIESIYGAFRGESGFGSCYDEPDCWFTANKIVVGLDKTYNGPFAMGPDYYTHESYQLLITSFENNDPTGPIAGKADNINKSDLILDTNERASVNGNRYFFFPDQVATSFYAQISAIKKDEDNINKLCDHYGINGEGKKFIWGMRGDAIHRGGGLIQVSLKTNKDGSLLNPQERWQTAYCLELAKSGLYKKIINLSNEHNFSDKCKDDLRTFLKQAEQSNSCGFNIQWSTKSFDMPGYPGNPDYGVSGILRYMYGAKAVTETRTYIDLWFDLLGLSLEPSYNLELNETPGEIQGFWTDYSGKSLSTTEIKAYADKVNSSVATAIFKSVGLRDIGAVTYKIDRWKKLGKDVGTIHYRQIRKSNNSNVLDCNDIQPNWTSSEPMSATFCGGFSLAMCYSTILHRYINQAEISIAMNTYNLRHNENVGMFTGLTNCVVTREAMKVLTEEMKFNDKQLLNFEEIQNIKTLTASEVANKLNSDAMIIINSSSRGHALTTGGHYIVLREAIKNTDGTYGFLLANSTCTLNKAAWYQQDYVWTWDELRGMIGGSSGVENKGSVISPGDGYADYMGVIKSSNAQTSIDKFLREYQKTFEELCKKKIKFGAKVTLQGKTMKVNSYSMVNIAISLYKNKDTSYLKLKDYDDLSKDNFIEINDYASLVPGDIVILDGNIKGTGVVNSNNNILLLKSDYLTADESAIGYDKKLFKKAFKKGWRPQ